MYASSTSWKAPAVTFNPGPSQLSPKIVQAIQEIASSGFLSVSHRGAAFMEVSRQAIEGLRERMRLPQDCRIYYQASATAAMDTLLRNLVIKKSFHFVHGAFSSLFFKTAVGIGLEAVAYDSPWDKVIAWDKADPPKGTELIAITHNETSTGLIWPSDQIHLLRRRFPDQLLAVDATSTFGAMVMNWDDADIWFGSVQKCLGLPAGLGFLIVNQRAFDKAKHVIEAKQGIPPWQRFDELEEKMKKYQTPETPNMLNIALLARQMADWNLAENEAALFRKAKLLYEAQLSWKPYVVDAGWRSPTVLNFLVDVPDLWHKTAGQADIVLGKGYGPLKEKCVRIANFPAISQEHVQKLIDQLSKIV